MSDKILIIEDDNSVLELCKKILERNNFSVAATNNPSEAFKYLEQKYFHVVLTDIKMPEMDGITLLKKLKEKYPKLPVILMTADRTTELVVDALKSGASDYLLKPFDSNELLNTVKNTIEHSKLKKQAKFFSNIISMYKFVSELTRDKKEEELLEYVLVNACKILNAEAGAIFKYDEQTEKMKLLVSKGKFGIFPDKKNIEDFIIQKESYIYHEKIDKLKIISIIVIPITLKNNLIGALRLCREGGEKIAFTEDEKNIAEIFSSHAALIIGNFYSIKTQEEYNRLRSEFLSNVSHELRTPLMSISGALEIISSGESEGKERFVDIIKRNVKRIDNLVKELLDFNKIETGTIKYNFKKIDAVSLINKIYNNFNFLFQTKGVSLTVKLNSHKSFIEIYADEERMIQALGNLLSNALKFSKQNTEVTLGMEKKGDKLIFSVRDEGLGIDKTFHNKIFDKFFQINGSTKRETGGFGLGLSIVKSIIEAHNGEIKLESEPGKGSTFYVILPTRITNYAGATKRYK